MNPLQSPIFIERLAFLRESQYWSSEKIRDIQVRKLIHLVNHVQNHVPYYRDFMKTAGFTWEDIQDIEDVKRFPLISKSIIQNNYDAFLVDYIDKSRLAHRTTGGSTGTPLTVFSDDDFFARDKANTEYYMNVFDLNIFLHRSVRLYGDKIHPNLIKNGKYWFVEDGRKLVMSCYHINMETALSYVEQINKFEPVYIHTRPSSILPLAKYMLSGKLVLESPIQAVFCDGEYLTEGQRDIVEKAFQARLVNIYGHTEGCIVGHPCKESNQMHFMPQVGILELLDTSANEVSEPGQKGEMVVTGFNNYGFPLIRYCTGDIAILGNKGCVCGRNYKMIQEVEGRIQDYVVSRDGDVVPLAPAVFNYNDMDWKGIRQFKVIQEQEGLLTIRVQPEQELMMSPNSARLNIEEKISAIMGSAFTVSVEFVDDIPKTQIGKYRYLDQKLDLSAYFSFNSSGIMY